MKSKKIMFFFLLIQVFVSTIVMAGSESDPFENNRIPNYQWDHVSIFLSINLRKKFVVTPDVKVFDNMELKGDPSFVFSNKMITDFRNEKSIRYIFEDQYKFKPNAREMFAVDDIPLDFVTVQAMGFFIGFSDYKNSLVVLIDKGKSYYFYQKDRGYPLNGSYKIWKKNYNTEDNITYLNDLIKKDEQIKNIFLSARECTIKKDVACLVKYLGGSIYDPFVTEKNAFTVKWEHMASILNLEKGKITLSKETEDFGDGEILEITQKDKYSNILKLSRHKDKDNNKWHVEFKYSDMD